MTRLLLRHRAAEMYCLCFVVCTSKPLALEPPVFRHGEYVRGHYPHWIKVSDVPEDKWFRAAYDNTNTVLADGTYEAIGPHFATNPYHLKKDILVHHGDEIVDVERTFEGIKKYLENHYIEGLVFWKDDEPMCKIKRSDFGFSWK